MCSRLKCLETGNTSHKQMRCINVLPKSTVDGNVCCLPWKYEVRCSVYNLLLLFKELLTLLLVVESNIKEIKN